MTTKDKRFKLHKSLYVKDERKTMTSSSYKTKDICLDASATLEKKKKLTEKMATIRYDLLGLPIYGFQLRKEFFQNHVLGWSGGWFLRPIMQQLELCFVKLWSICVGGRSSLSLHF